MKIISIENVSLSFNKVPVLRNISFSVEEGERLVIVGDSGCGKTSILRLIAGFVAPHSGRILLRGQLVAENGRIIVPPQHRSVGMVFQDLALWPHLSVSGNLDFVLKAAGISRNDRQKRIDDMLGMVDMQEFAERKPGKLSGGQQQRVALARALVVKPSVILMDEPLTALHDELNVRLRREIIRLHKETGTTIIYVTHNREEAAEIATRTLQIGPTGILKQ